jgi:hypothetical protein
LRRKEAKVAAAIAKRDFASAAQGQERISEAKKKMVDTMEAEAAISAEKDASEGSPPEAAYRRHL